VQGLARALGPGTETSSVCEYVGTTADVRGCTNSAVGKEPKLPDVSADTARLVPQSRYCRLNFSAAAKTKGQDSPGSLSLQMPTVDQLDII
jgi:hypothetical protein